MRKLTTKLQRCIEKNTQLRAKFAEQPEKFMESETDLDAAIRSLSILSQFPELFTEFVHTGSVLLLIQLLSHENTDIAIDVMEVLDELTDEDVSADDEQMNALMSELLSNELIPLLISNLQRLSETTSDLDRLGVFRSLAIVENLVSYDPQLAEPILQQTKLLQWLLSRIQEKETIVSQNKQYAAEILSILIPSVPNVQQFLDLKGIDIILRLLSPYRKREPEKNSNEEEFAENLFDSLCAAVDQPLGRSAFRQEEGVELMLLMLHESKFCRSRVLRVLDHACGGLPSEALEVCEKVIDAGGLKPLSNVLMKKKLDREDMEHLVAIYASCLRSLPLEGAHRIRFLAKFVEKDYEKVKRFIQMHSEVSARLSSIEKEIADRLPTLSTEEKEDQETLWYVERLDRGLYTIQMIDIVFAWLCIEDDGINATLNGLSNLKPTDIKYVLQGEIFPTSFHLD